MSEKLNRHAKTESCTYLLKTHYKIEAKNSKLIIVKLRQKFLSINGLQ